MPQNLQKYVDDVIDQIRFGLIVGMKITWLEN